MVKSENDRSQISHPSVSPCGDPLLVNNYVVHLRKVAAAESEPTVPLQSGSVEEQSSSDIIRKIYGVGL